VTRLRAWIVRHWQLKLTALAFAVGLWLFVATEERSEAVYTVPIDLVDQPPDVQVSSIAVETVIVRVEGRRSLLRQLHEEDFRAAVSLKNARPGRFVARIDADQVEAPAGVRIVRVTPNEIRVTIEAR
jgi:YbbR domain-containing protein